MNIAIDIGHANGTGARGNGREEHAACAAIATHLAARLQALGHGARIIDFPHLSNAEDLRQTAAAINAGDDNLSVSLHCDASDNPAACGAHVCHCSAAGGKAAAAIAARLCRLMPGRAQPVVLRKDLYILKRTRPAAVLIECGFITNAKDADLQQRSAAAIAWAIAQGISDYAAGI